MSDCQLQANMSYKTMVQENQSGYATKVNLAKTNCSISLLIEGHHKDSGNYLCFIHSHMIGM